MELLVGDIKNFFNEIGIEAVFTGCQSVKVNTYSTLKKISDGRITWIKQWSDETYQKLESLSDLIVVTAKRDIQSEKNCYICHKDPKMCFFEIVEHFFGARQQSQGIAQTAIVKTKQIGVNTSIGHYAIISKDAVIGDSVVIENGVTIIGRVKIGDSCVIHSGVVIGKPGYGYYEGLDGHTKRVPHLGGVTIGDFVEIGANTVIDRGTLDDTIVGSYSKIDNMCHIGHNVIIENDVNIVAGTIICGSVHIGANSYIAPGAVVKNQSRIGEKAFIGMQTCVMKDVEDGDSVFGIPARHFPRTYQP